MLVLLCAETWVTIADDELRPQLGELRLQLERLECERDLYLGLLTLGEEDVLESFMAQALALITKSVAAERGYLELSDPTRDGDSEPVYLAAGCSPEEVEHIRDTVSSGIIAHAVAKGQILAVPSALLDPRFKDRASVRRSKIEAVLCAPLGQEAPVGVLYLQGRKESGPFGKADVRRAELFAHHIEPLVQRLFARAREAARSPISDVRRRLKVGSIIGSSSALAHLLREVELAAPLDLCLLIRGDTGTGKSQLAHVIHTNSARSSGPFVEINCATIPENLTESELFGAFAGAHSTATARIEGKVAAAQGGTLFLDEITELSVSAQAKLLQLLQTKAYYPLGSSKPLRADVRVIAATNVDLEAAIREQGFREDLYYRLNVLPLRVPSLAERQEDVAQLAVHFCEQAIRQHTLAPVSLSPAAKRELTARDWPGNVRELAHAVEIGAIRASAARAVQVEPVHLFPGTAQFSPGDRRLSFHEQTRRFQSQLLAAALEEKDWNVAAVARELDLTRAHVYNLLKSFGLARGK